MKMKTRPIAALTLMCICFAAPAVAAEDEGPTYGRRVNTIEEVARSQKGSYDVYIDKPTGYAFVNTIVGWKFTRKISDEALAAERCQAAELADESRQEAPLARR